MIDSVKSRKGKAREGYAKERASRIIGNAPRIKWTERDHAALKRNWHKVDMKTLCLILDDRSASAIEREAARLHLGPQRPEGTESMAKLAIELKCSYEKLTRVLEWAGVNRDGRSVDPGAAKPRRYNVSIQAARKALDRWNDSETEVVAAIRLGVASWLPGKWLETEGVKREKYARYEKSYWDGLSAKHRTKGVTIGRLSQLTGIEEDRVRAFFRKRKLLHDMKDKALVPKSLKTTVSLAWALEMLRDSCLQTSDAASP